MPASFLNAAGKVQSVSTAAPLPVDLIETRAATSAAVTGSAVATGFSGAFAPELGRPVYLTLSGTWVGTVSLQRSIDGGTTWHDLRVVDDLFPVLTVNGLRPVWDEFQSGATIRLSITHTSGTVTYRLSQ